jgi:hypothetical protein
MSMLLLALAVFVLAPAGNAQRSPRPFARVLNETGARVTVGQPVSVRVEVLVPSWFTGAPSWPNVDLPDAFTIFRSSGYNLSDRIDGQSWAGQARYYIVYPQRPGSYEIDEIPIEVRYSVDGRTNTVVVSPPRLAFEAVLPPEAAGLSYFIATSDLDIDQSFDVEPDTLRVGEAFQRTITVTVQNAMGMVVPPLARDTIPGVGVYASPPVVEENSAERGEAIIGTRVESITYVAESEGDYVVPAIELAWWDLNARRLRRDSLAAIELTVVPAPTAAAIPLPADEFEEAAPDSKRPRVSVAALLKRWGPPGVALIALVWFFVRLGRRIGPRIRSRVAEWRHERAESEATYFRRFQSAARSGDARAAWRELTVWLDRIHAVAGAVSVREFVQRSGDPELQSEIDALDRLLFAGVEEPAASWSGERLARCASRARRHSCSGSGTADRLATAPELNPRR